MGKKFDWKTLSFKAEPTKAQFSSPAVYGPYPNTVLDGVPITTMDEHIRYVFSGTATVTKADALAIPAVLRGRNLICNIATLPLVTMRGDFEVVLNEFLRQINPALPNLVTLANTVEDLLFHAKAYWYVDLFDNRLSPYPLRAHHVPYESLSQDSSGQYWIDGRKADANRIIDFHSPNPALLSTIAASIERAKALSTAALMYANKPVPKVIVSPKADVDPEQEDIDTAMGQLSDAAAASPFVYASAGMDITALNMLSPTDLQLVESMKMVAIDLANALGIDPEDLGVSTTSRTYQNAVDRRKDRVNDVLNVYMKAITDRLTMGDVTPEPYFVRFDQDDYLRADPKTRMDVYTGYIAAGVMTVDEVRTKEGLPAMTAEQKAELKPAPQAKAIAASRKPGATFSNDNDADLVLGAKFTKDGVNPDSRTVEVLAVSWNEVAKTGGREFLFKPGSIKLNYDKLNHLKLLRDHDYTQSVGHAIDYKETDDGLVVKFQIAKGKAGDESLAGFIEKNYDGVSIGVDFTADGITEDRNLPGVVVVEGALLNEISQVAIPAFKNSRALSATYSRKGETQMSENTPGAVETAPAEKTYTLAEFQAMQATFSKPAPEKPASVQADTNVAPRETKANTQEKPVGATFVSEPVPYRFGETGAEFEFSRDIIQLGKGKDDGNGRKRVMDFMKAEFAVSTSNASTLNPTIQRPDMYVDQLDYSTPVWNTINKGAPSNGVNPFAFPKYSSSSGLVADHTEGTEPSLGAFAVTNQTVTPTALSGKIEINREAWDMGGSPGLSLLVRNEMRRAYREGLETAAAAFLDAQSFTTITLTTAAADSALEGEVIDALVALQNARGGFRLTDLLLHTDLFKALVKAKDSSGRRLYPALGPTNANGVVTSGYASININGLIGRNAWSLGASGVVAEKSYLLNPEDVHGWATAPEDLTFDIQVKSIYLGIWGYKAFAVSRAEGVRTISYDPS